MNYSRVPEFEKDVKALNKRVRSLEGDSERAKHLIEALYGRHDAEQTEFKKRFLAGKKATILTKAGVVEVVKMRLDTDTDSYRGKLRLVFAVAVDKAEVSFIELYSKNDKPREDQHRLRRYDASGYWYCNQLMVK